MIVRKKQIVPILIEWNGGDLSEALADTLIRNGAYGVEIDCDADVEYCPSPKPKREHIVFRVGVGEDYPLWKLLSDVAAYPGVYSVGEI